LRFILGSFDFEPLADGKKQLKGVNIAHIPISLDYFGKWFTDQVISQGETRKSFPILYFIRNLCNNLLQESMLEGCVNRNVEKKLRFMTSQITAWKGGANKPDPISSLSNRKSPIDVSKNRGGKNEFPLKGDSTSREITNRANKISGFQNYLLVCTQGTSLTHDGRGRYDEDVKNGRYHVSIGSNRGIVKTVKFSKTDMQYVREARFFQQGINGLLQLANVYKVTVEMFGNTLFFPGMEIYVNPFGIGGSGLGSPTQGGASASIANLLGFGGYHTIIGVKTTLTPTNFTTTVDSQWYYSGADSDKRELKDGNKNKKTKQQKSDAELKNQTISVSDQNQEQQNRCVNLIKTVQLNPEATNTLASGAEHQGQNLNHKWERHLHSNSYLALLLQILVVVVVAIMHQSRLSKISQV
jgi:hypothetical protein